MESDDTLLRLSLAWKVGLIDKFLFPKQKKQCIKKGVSGHSTVNYVGIQSFIMKLSYSLTLNFGDFFKFLIGWFKLVVTKLSNQ